MKKTLHLATKKIDLRVTKIMGELVVSNSDTFSVDAYVEEARKIAESGAELLEIGMPREDCNDNLQAEEQCLIPVVKAISTAVPKLIIGVATSSPKIMELANVSGASLLIDFNALRCEGALETVAKLQLPVMLTFDPFIIPQDDPVAAVSEFLYERIDACLNAGIPRRNLLIDPNLGTINKFDARLKMFGRLASFKSFALPISVAIPRCLPYADNFLMENKSASISLGIFCADRGVNIIRTAHVAEMALALATWQLVTKTARPYQLSKSIISRFRKMRNKFRERKRNAQENRRE